jgi:hypothetical protein
MKQLIFICAFAIALSTSAQEAVPRFNKFQLGAVFSPDISNRVLKDQNQEGLFKFVENEADWKPGFTTGLVLCYNSSASWGFEIGVQYANMGFQMSRSDLVYGDYIGGNRIYETQDPAIDTYNRRLNYHYLGIPLRVIWSAGQGDLRFVSSIGITSNFLLKVTEVNTLELENGSTMRDTYEILNEFNGFGLSPTLSLGANYRVGEVITLRLEPTFRYGLIETGAFSDFTEDSEHLLSVGLSFTCYYALR